MRHHAAFINAIAEGRNFNEAIKWLQQIWDELIDAQKDQERYEFLRSPYAAYHGIEVSFDKSLFDITKGVNFDACVDLAKANADAQQLRSEYCESCGYTASHDPNCPRERQAT